MPFLFEIPDDVIDSLGLPREEVEGEFRAELAAVLYARGMLSMGKAAEMSGRFRWKFEELLAEREIARNYSEEDLQHDLEWSRTQSRAPRP
ncbi:MAG: UPF0175 family protein [Chthoniobacter sp.]